ncbi:MAG: helicase-related protein [Planctomycetota bacterium]
MQIVDASDRPALDLEVVVPVADMDRSPARLPLPRRRPRRGRPCSSSARSSRRASGPTSWADLAGSGPPLDDRVRQQSPALRAPDQHLNDLAGEKARARTHGSLSHARREQVEEQLKAGTLRGIVATSSLELGIDMGAVDLVILIESQGPWPAGQRAGRAEHQVGETSQVRLFPSAGATCSRRRR